MEGIWGTDIMLSFFTKGVFEWTPPLGPALRHKEPEIPGCDWIGINYYGRCSTVALACTTISRLSECKTGAQLEQLTASAFQQAKINYPNKDEEHILHAGLYWTGSSRQLDWQARG